MDDPRLSRPTSDKGRLQRACLTLLQEHQRDGALPTSERFLWYELVQRGVVDKTKARGHPGVRKGVDQYVSEALTHLRERGVVPWDWLVDETRSVQVWTYARTVADFIDEAVDRARIDMWDGEPPPLLLVESRSLAGVLRNLTADYLVPLAATNGQVGGFLHTDVAPLLTKNRLVLYLGDHDLSGHQIEANTRRVLETYEYLRWERLALLPEHVRAYGLPVVSKTDNRYQPPRVHQAVETESLSQRVVVSLVQTRLDQLLPEPLSSVLVREQYQRDEVRQRLDS